MIRAIADTHAVIWYGRNDARLSTAARVFIEDIARTGDQVGVSAITLVEIVYLAEKGRIDSTTFDRLIADLGSRDAVLVEVPVDRAVAQTLMFVDRAQIPEMGDRIIAATAQHLGVPVITRDTNITESSVPTIW